MAAAAPRLTSWSGNSLMPTQRLSRAVRAVAIAVLAGVWAPSASFAEQFVLFDVTFSFTKADADNARPSKSHYYVRGPMLNADRPRDWTAPVDYRNGTVHIRAEVIEKPPGGRAHDLDASATSRTAGRGTATAAPARSSTARRACTRRTYRLKSFWQNDAIVWSQGIKQMDLVIKDDSGGGGHMRTSGPTRSGSSRPGCGSPWVQVSAGSKYDPSLVPKLPRGTAPPATGDKTEDGGGCCCGQAGGRAKQVVVVMLNVLMVWALGGTDKRLRLSVGPTAGLRGH